MSIASARAEKNSRPCALAYWRTFPAEAFGSEVCDEVVSCVRRISSTIPQWRSAIAGDAGAASGLALKLPIPDRIGPRVDLIMTVLLRCAFDDAGAALVLANRLQKMPIRPRDRARLSTSWLVHNLYLARRRPWTPTDSLGSPEAEGWTMRIQIVSDLHTRYPGARRFPPLAPGVGLMLIGGDTCEGLARAIREMRAAYPATEIVAVAGNHEFYKSAYFEALEEGRECARELGVHFVENGTARLGRLRVVGATLWTDYDLFGTRLREAAMRTASDALHDHQRIKWNLNPWARFRPQEARALHLQSRSYIEAELAIPHDGPTIVLSHHGAALDAARPASRGQMIAAAYTSDMLPVIDRYQPYAWIWGHTHFAVDLRRGRTRLISNPCGYAGEVTGFDPSFTIEVDA